MFFQCFEKKRINKQTKFIRYTHLQAILYRELIKRDTVTPDLSIYEWPKLPKMFLFPYTGWFIRSQQLNWSSRSWDMATFRPLLCKMVHIRTFRKMHIKNRVFNILLKRIALKFIKLFPLKYILNWTKLRWNGSFTITHILWILKMTMKYFVVLQS
jgi:hypothetical protein